MSDGRTGLVAMTDAVLERVGSAWERLGPLSAGAVASSVVIVGAGTIVRRMLGSRNGRLLGWASAVALVPLGLWLLTETGQEEKVEEALGDETARLPEEVETSETAEA